MPTVEEFRAALADADAGAIVDRWLLAPGAKHVESEKIDRIQSRLAAAYGVQIDDTNVWITGSAKLGFSISEKKRKDAPTLPRYRPFGALSDIDVAVVSPPIFDLVWGELARHSHQQPYFPWASGRLGDYFVCGWIRPDHFPKNVRLRRCDDWKDTFRHLSGRYRRSVKGGLFHSVEHLRRYMSRAVNECIDLEEGK